MRLFVALPSWISVILAMCLLPSVQSRPRTLSKAERIASILAQKPMHTTALLAGAAMPTPSPYPPGDSDLGYVLKPPPAEEDIEDLEPEDDDEEFKVELRR
ncbi:MAG: hypothetical protein Q9207_004849 [Kuettlingeria erythrocarpa]